MRAPKVCSDPECVTLVYGGKSSCPEHQDWQRRSPSSQRTGRRDFSKTRAKVFARDHHACTIKGPRCNGKAEECDHIIEVAAGGDDEMPNLRAACRPCHRWRTAQRAAAVASHSPVEPRTPPRPSSGVPRAIRII